MSATRFFRLLVWAGVLVAALAGAAGSQPAQLAQLTLPTAAPAPAVSGLVLSGLYALAPIDLDGETVVRLGALANAPLAQLPIATRVIDVRTALGALLAETGTGAKSTPIFDPRTLRVHVRRVGDLDVLEAVDAKHADPLPIVTVTITDARANGAASVDALAAQWQAALQSALTRALALRQPAAEKASLQRIAQVAILLVAVTLSVLGVMRALWRRMQLLENEIAERSRAAAATAPPSADAPAADKQRRRSFASALRDLEPESRLSLYGAIAESCLWALLLAWFIAITWALSLFAETTPLAQIITHSTLGVAGTVLVIGLLNRILDVAITRAAAAWRLRRYGSSDDRARLVLRIPTIARAAAGAKTFVLVFVAVLSVFGQIGVPIGSVVTIGGLAAIALSLAAQNFVRDFLNGFLVLYEDQYVAGDFVTINAFSGIVETLTLRMVQLRDAAGDLITIPHSSVVNVVNQSRNWSRVDYRVPVDPAADIGKAVAVVQTEIEALAAQGALTHGIAQPLEWIGIEALSRDGIVVRASIRTAPLRQFELRRLLNDRVRSGFAQAGIAFGAPLPTP
jgi:small conductance mechanosensitive channel